MNVGWAWNRSGDWVGVKPTALFFPPKFTVLLIFRDISYFSSFPSCHLKFSCQEILQGWHYNFNDNKTGQRLLAFFKEGTLKLSSWTVVRETHDLSMGLMVKLISCNEVCGVASWGEKQKLYKLLAQGFLFKSASCLKCYHYAKHTQTSFKLKTDHCLPLLCQLEFSRLDSRVNTAALLASVDILCMRACAHTHRHRHNLSGWHWSKVFHPWLF